MKKLLSLRAFVDYLVMTHGLLSPKAKDMFGVIHNYNHRFLKRKLNLSMFVPFDSEEGLLKEPSGGDLMSLDWQNYNAAKKNVIFDKSCFGCKELSSGWIEVSIGNRGGVYIFNKEGWMKYGDIELWELAKETENEPLLMIKEAVKI